MKEVRTIINAYKEIDFTKDKAALVTVVGLEGSSYRRMGARMLVKDNGIYLGGISGGCLEGDALRRAQLAIIKDKPSIVRYDTTQDDDHQIGVGLGCNGIIDVLFVPLTADSSGNPVNILASISDSRLPNILLTIIEIDNVVKGHSLLFSDENQLTALFEKNEIRRLVLKDIQKSVRNQSSYSQEYNLGDSTTKLFIEFIAPETRLVIVGNNNDIYSVALIANELGWKVTIITNRLKATKKIFEIATEVLEISSPDLEQIDTFTAVVLMTHDYRTDLSLFPEILKTPAEYIGILGPKKRADKLFRESKLEDEVQSEYNQSRIFAPTGLDIGANTPEEIALSIIAEIRAKFAGRDGGFLKLREGTIYGQ